MNSLFSGPFKGKVTYLKIPGFSKKYFLYPLPPGWIFSEKAHSGNSNLFFLTCGVPKGSVLGPLLFLVYINNIHKSDSEASFCLFADNTSLSFAEKNIGRLETKVNTQLENITNWLKVNKN